MSSAFHASAPLPRKPSDLLCSDVSEGQVLTDLHSLGIKPVGTFHLETGAWRIGRFSSCNVCSNSSAAVWVQALESWDAGPPGRCWSSLCFSPVSHPCLSLSSLRSSQPRLPGLLPPACASLGPCVPVPARLLLQGVGFSPTSEASSRRSYIHTGGWWQPCSEQVYGHRFPNSVHSLLCTTFWEFSQYFRPLHYYIC